MAASHLAVAITALAIGQQVRHRDYKGRRVTGTVRAIAIEDQALMATIALDAPIIVPAGDGIPEIRIHRQTVPAHELVPFDHRDELMAEMLAALQLAEREMSAMRAAVGAGLLTDKAIDMARAAIDMATGAPS